MSRKRKKPTCENSFSCHGLHLNPDQHEITTLFQKCQFCAETSKFVCDHDRQPQINALNSFKTLLACNKSAAVTLNIDLEKATLPKKLCKIFDGFEVPPDGDCFYSAVSVCLKKCRCLAGFLRQASILEYLFNDHVHSFLNKCNVPQEEIMKRAQVGSWANESAMFLVSSVISKRIEVIQLTAQNHWNHYYYDANSSGPSDRIYVFLDVDHFYPLFPKSSATKLPEGNYTPFQSMQRNRKGNQKVSVFQQTERVMVSAGQTETNRHENCFITSICLQKPRNSASSCNAVFGENNFLGQTNSSTIPKQRMQPLETEFLDVEKCPEPNIAIKQPLVRARKGTFTVNAHAMFQGCLRAIAKELHRLLAQHEEKAVKDFIYLCATSRTPWIERPAEGASFKKVQIQARKKHSIALLSLLRNAYFQNLFLKMLEDVNAGEFKSTFLNAVSKKFGSSTDDSKIMDTSEITQESVTTSNKDQDNFETATTNPDSNADDATTVLKEKRADNYADVIGKDAIASVLNIASSDLQFEPPVSFEVVLSSEILGKCFDFEQERFLDRKWAACLSEQITTTQGACCFKAWRQPTYHKRRGSDFAVLQGYCGCGLMFKAVAGQKPVKGESLKVSITAMGSFSLIQQKFTGRPITGEEREEIAKRLHHVKAEAVFLENLAHVTAHRFLHNNQLQSSREVLRKIRSEQRLKGRLDRDPNEDILLLKTKYDSDSPKAAKVKGYIQYVNTSPGNFKIILFDQGSLSLHADQASKRGTVCYLDATGGVVTKHGGKEILLYRLLGKRVSGCTYTIAEMLSEHGTIVEVTDFLKRVKQGILKVRPQFSCAMADMVVTDWSWPFLHSCINGWNTESLQDYVRRSFDYLTGVETRWPKNKSCVFICTSHFIHAVQLNISRKLQLSRSRKLILTCALDSVARLQESFSISELRSVIRDMTRLFGQKQLSEDTIKEISERMKQHKTILEPVSDDTFQECSSTIDDIQMSFENFEDYKLMREQSPFYHVFKQERDMQLMIREEDANIKNPYYCPAVLNAIEKEKIALFPLWASAIPHKVGVDENFLRETNSTVESSFHHLKNLQSADGRVTVPTFVRNRYEMHNGENREAINKLIGSQNVSKVKDPSTLLVHEAWKRKQKKISNHFSPTNKKRYKTLFQGRKARLDEVTPDSKINACSTPNMDSGKSDAVETQPVTVPLYPKFGIANIGFTCYMNATLQLLLSLPPIQRFTQGNDDINRLLKYVHVRVRGISGKGVTEENAKVVHAYVHEIFQKANIKDEYKIGVQHDANEFFRTLTNLPGLEEFKEEFMFSFVRSYSCSRCNYLTTLNETSDTIIVDVSRDFLTGLDDYFKSSELSTCPECKNSTLSNTVVLSTKPNLLLIATNIVGGQLNEKGMFVNEKIRANDFAGNSLSISGTKYSLHGFVSHIGPQANFGHYVSYLCQKDSFVCCDDDRISIVNQIRGDVYFYVYKRM